MAAAPRFRNAPRMTRWSGTRLDHRSRARFSGSLIATDPLIITPVVNPGDHSVELSIAWTDWKYYDAR